MACGYHSAVANRGRALQINPLAVTQIVARNITPLAGIVLFKWPAGNVLVLYLLDTMLSIAVLIAGIAVYWLPPSEEQDIGGWLNAQAGPVLAGLLVAAILAVPLGMPVFMMLGVSGFSYHDALNDASLRGGVICQAIAALWSYASLYRAVREHTPEELKLKRRFALVILRWFAVLMIAYTGIPLALGRYGVLTLIVAYVAVSVFAEIAPDKFLRMMPGGAEDAEGPTASPRASLSVGPRTATTSPQDAPSLSRKRRRRR
jgi:hypothetical protein